MLGDCGSNSAYQRWLKLCYRICSLPCQLNVVVTVSRECGFNRVIWRIITVLWNVVVTASSDGRDCGSYRVRVNGMRW